MRKSVFTLLLPAILLMSATTRLSAQSVNIVPNGGFEEWVKENPEGKEIENEPTEWNVKFEFVPSQVPESRPESTGKYSLRLWCNGGFIYMNKDMPVVEKKKYTFSFWHKGSKSNTQMRILLRWLKGDEPEGRQEIKARTVAGEWTKEEVEVTIPDGIDNMKISLSPGNSSGANILFDDISMLAGDNTPPTPEPSLETPRNLQVKAYQGEMEISWDRATDNNVKWEVLFDDKAETTTSQNSYIKTKLKPGSNHTVKVRAVKDKEFSPYVEKSATTERMKEAENSEERIPYLRALTPDGNCKGRFLPLYYSELANPNAKITYKLDGVAVEPKGDVLEFPAFEGSYKQFRLEIHIDEGAGRLWDILYTQLGVEM